MMIWVCFDQYVSMIFSHQMVPTNFTINPKKLQNMEEKRNIILNAIQHAKGIFSQISAIYRLSAGLFIGGQKYGNIYSLRGNGYCNQMCNTMECLYDNGDCDGIDPIANKRDSREAYHNSVDFVNYLLDYQYKYVSKSFLPIQSRPYLDVVCPDWPIYRLF